MQIHSINRPLKGIGQIIRLDKTESTQDIAKELAKSAQPASTLVITKTQTKGRGRLEKEWISDIGGLYFSVILRPRVTTAKLGSLNIKTAEVIAKVLKKLYSVNARIKAPNDVLALNPLKKKFLKIAGILIESSSTADQPEWVTLGVGVNLNNDISPQLEEAVSLKEIIGKSVSADEFLSEFFNLFWDAYGEWEVSVN